MAHYLRALDDGTQLTADDYETMVRLWNTISWGDVPPDAGPIDEFKARFFPSEVRAASEALGMTLSKGMAMYSVERDLYLGGTPHANSKYEIVD